MTVSFKQKLACTRSLCVIIVEIPLCVTLSSSLLCSVKLLAHTTRSRCTIQKSIEMQAWMQFVERNKSSVLFDGMLQFVSVICCMKGTFRFTFVHNSYAFSVHCDCFSWLIIFDLFAFFKFIFYFKRIHQHFDFAKRFAFRSMLLDFNINIWRLAAMQSTENCATIELYVIDRLTRCWINIVDVDVVDRHRWRITFAALSLSLQFFFSIEFQSLSKIRISVSVYTFFDR